jgi:uncharacterized membrane protein YhaH (DUF805 family)
VSSPYNPPGVPGGYGYGAPDYPQQRGYLQGGPVSFQDAIKMQFENVLNFNGRASLSAFWWYALAIFIVNIVVEIIFGVAIGSLALTYIVGLVIGLSGLSVSVRRLHDSDKTGWLLLLDLIPFVGWIAVLVLLLLPSTPGPNRFG